MALLYPSDRARMETRNPRPIGSRWLRGHGKASQDGEWGLTLVTW